jgi:hypothetical protein
MLLRCLTGRFSRRLCWQQLFDCHSFPFSRCASRTVLENRALRHLWHGHQKARSWGKIMWPHSSQICRPFSKILMTLNSPFKAQYGQRGTADVLAAESMQVPSRTQAASFLALLIRRRNPPCRRHCPATRAVILRTTLQY